MTALEALRWVSIIRAQKRLPKILAEVFEQFKDAETDDVTLQRIRRAIDDGLKGLFRPDEIQVVCKVQRQKGGRVEVEIFAADEITPKEPKTRSKRSRRRPK